jgi:hypothetical protein
MKGKKTKAAKKAKITIPSHQMKRERSQSKPVPHREPKAAYLTQRPER